MIYIHTLEFCSTSVILVRVCSNIVTQMPTQAHFKDGDEISSLWCGIRACVNTFCLAITGWFAVRFKLYSDVSLLLSFKKPFGA